jgi:CRISPR-associated endoribonuclease Cas6
MRQGRRVKYEGVIGRFRYSGDLDSFIPYLKLGEKIHVGKNTSFGFGKYKIEIY